jgi:hypothetical protein
MKLEPGTSGGPAVTRREMPLTTRLAPIGSYNEKARTVDLVWSAGGMVKRYDWERRQFYMEALSLDPAHIRMGRMQSGAPLLNNHNRWELTDVLGVVESASFAKGEARATVRFSEREDVAPILQDVQTGIIRNVSVGYATYRIEQLPPSTESEGLPIYRAIDWEPMEVSLVPIGADPGAGVRSADGKPVAPDSQVRTFPCDFTAVPTPAAAGTTARKEPAMVTKQQMFKLLTKAAPNQTAGKTVDDFTDQDLALRCSVALDALDALDARAAGGSQPVPVAHPVPAAVPAPAVTDAEAVRTAERTRIGEINTLAQRHGLDAAFVNKHIDAGTAPAAVRAAVLDELAARSKTNAPQSGLPGGHVDVLSDETVNLREHVSNALMHRALPGQIKLDEGAKQYRGYTLREMARLMLEMRGIKTAGMSIQQIAERTFMSGSDLPNILLDAANKSLRRAYDATQRTFTVWANAASAPDFKNINRTLLSGAPSLLEVKSGGEFKYGSVTDGKETYALATYGRIIGINRQTIINDDLQAFTRLPQLCANAAADLQSDTVYGILTTNAALADGVALFSVATHANLTSSGTAISVDSLGVARAALRKQTGLEGRPINLTMKTLLVPAAKETIAQQFASQAYIAAQSSNINPFAGQLTVVAEPRLDANSGVSWYGIADPAQIDTVEYAFLEGSEGVYLESRMGFEVDGMELKVRQDFAAKALDFRGLYKNNGA